MTKRRESDECTNGTCVEIERGGSECAAGTCVSLETESQDIEQNRSSGPDRQVEIAPTSDVIESLKEKAGCVPEGLPGTDHVLLKFEFRRNRTSSSNRRQWPRILWKVLASAAGSAIVALALELAGYTDIFPFV